MTRYIALLVLVAAGCNGDKDGDSGTGTGDTATGGETGDTDTQTDCAGGAYVGDIALTAVNVECTGTTATITAETNGVTGGGMLFSQETGNVEPNFSENHPLANTPDTVCNVDSLSVSLEHDAAAPEYLAGTDTAFSCDGHYNDPAVMTYAIAVTDAGGTVADCWSWGENVAQMTDGTLGRVNEPDFDLTQCTEYTPMR